ncbi:hypothetical protein OEZ86_009896 [Tetradesmus obliquus]|uniref:Cation efflux protein cytoplasmic domain-containing protein n=1 Tax=Tetradesmus obliquus TaxID=3088 RepID=A0ABY8UQM5_TETOB|nr:hypothetical protein OEZ85_001333 [Tetradesmus obliquus]WIA43420.1 hypothetical protein OEZ86_009896 [Tetradesmus obliquus]
MRRSSDETGTGQLSTSYTRRTSFLQRQQPPRISSHDHVITLTSDQPSPAATSPTGLTPQLTPQLTPSSSSADSAVDLVSQVVIAYADWRVRREDPRFPVGQARLEAIGVLACACIMSVASFEVIQESVAVLVAALQTGVLPELRLGPVMYIVLGSATALKLLCWAVCAALQSKSDSMLALAEDHLNDIMSNLCAIVTAVLAGVVANGWWVDPVGAIAISGYIVARWLAIAKQQVDKIVGRGAPQRFIQQLEALAASHHAALGLDVIRAYHFGARYIVEMEVVLPAGMTVRDSHDISLDLQHKVEQMEEVERAFVHVDYMRRDGLEHKVERELALARDRSLSMGSAGRRNSGSASGGQLGQRSSSSESCSSPEPAAAATAAAAAAAAAAAGHAEQLV